MTQCEGFTFFFDFFEFLLVDAKYGQNSGHDNSQLGVKFCKTRCVSLIKQHVLYVKMIFLKKSWESHDGAVVQNYLASY
jgi:hypothetical protein